MGDEGAHRAAPSSDALIAGVAILAIALHLSLRAALGSQELSGGLQWQSLPLLLSLLLGGAPLVWDLAQRAARLEFSSDLLAGISIVTALLLGEYLAGTFVVLMLAGGHVLEAYAVRHASAALQALARRMPSHAHRKRNGALQDLPLEEINPGDLIVVLPHETCPVDGVVEEGRSTMNEAFLTGEPYLLPKAVGAAVLSGAINGEGALTIRAEKKTVDSRYTKIMQVMRESEQRRPHLRRLGDQIGAYFTPLAAGIAIASWMISGDPVRFLSVLVVATPCPLLIAIPVVIISTISLATHRGIIIKDPTVLEMIDTCRTAVFDKTGTLTYGEPKLTAIEPAPGYEQDDLLAAVASVERYSRHPLSSAVLEAAQNGGLEIKEATEVREPPGQGLQGVVAGRTVEVTSRKLAAARSPDLAGSASPAQGGLECIVLLDGKYAGIFRFRDEPRVEGEPFISHLKPRHGFERVLLVSGDRESEVRYLAEKVGIKEIYASQSPEQKVALVRQETARANTVFMGDGINDAPALAAATVGIAFGQSSDVTAEAAGAVIFNSSLERVDELLHIGRRMRLIALQSAVGGMLLSSGAMLIAAAGYLPPVAGAITQELIDLLSVLNALRALMPPRLLTDYEGHRR